MADNYVYLKNLQGAVIKPVTDLSAINLTTGAGVGVQGNTIGVLNGFVAQEAFTALTDPADAAHPDSAYIAGGTMFTLIGGYTVSDEIPPAVDADPYKIPSELSVRSAIDAIATLGPSLTPGAGIVVTTVPGSTGGILSVAEGNGVEVKTAQQGGVSVKAGAGISVDSNGVSVVTATNNTFGGIAGATNGVTLVDGVAQVDAGDGLLIDSGKVVIDDAEVSEVLEDQRIIDGSTVTPVEDRVVTPGNLRGALSVGQAVDVSCAPYNNSGSIVYVNNDFLQGFTATMVNGTTVGFYDTTSHRFPKFADNLVYLFIANVSGSGTVTPNGASAVTLSGTPQRIWTKVTASDSGYISASANATMTVTNWRQYEVTALTDDAIAYIAQLPDPDAFFRSSTIFQVRDKYLVKQDMVCPWIFTIGMPDNSDLTVGAGLSYKIRYTNDNPHKITVDTIPTDAYGWDAHIQMFIKGTSSIVFQKPLILMDALTPNAGHNLLVKFRNGDAYVYVEDTNAGYIVTESSGTGAGTLNFGIVDPNTDYVIFAAALDGTTVDAGTAAFVGASTITTLNILGNGTDVTTITGDISAASGMTINLQSLTIDGGTFGGAGTINLDDVCINDFITNSTNLSIQAVDVSANNNTVVVTGGVITAQAGAQVIPYGETEPVAVIGTGNKLLNNGKLGYLVSDPAATTVANTLYDALVGGGTVYSNIIFDPALDGQTVSYTFAASTALPADRTIWGNGAGNTIIGGKLVFNYTNLLYVKDVTISCPIQTKGWIRNCVFTGGSTNNMNSNTLYYFRGGTYTFDAEITDCVFRDTDAGSYYLVSGNERSVATFTRCLFTGNTDGVSIQWPGSTTYPSYITLTGCTFTNNTHGTGALRGGYFLNSTITDCVFDTGEHIIIGGGSISFAGTNIIDSTVSGAGTLVFTNGATVTSTIPSGSTLGTGVISASIDNVDVSNKEITLENITITGSTVDGALLHGSTNTILNITNCAITGNTLSNTSDSAKGQTYPIFSDNASSVLNLSGVIVYSNTGNNSNKIYAYRGTTRVTGSTCNEFVTGFGAFTFYGENSGNIYMIPGGSAKLIFEPGSIMRNVPQASITASANSTIYVGTYDNTTGEVVVDGTATIVLNGTTVSISGSGTTIDSTGLHS